MTIAALDTLAETEASLAAAFKAGSINEVALATGLAAAYNAAFGGASTPLEAAVLAQQAISRLTSFIDDFLGNVGLKTKGVLASPTDLPATGNAIGDGYLIAGNLWVWAGSDWQNAGPITGADGVDGTDGVDGEDGSDGNDAWTPVFAAVADGVRRVLRVTDWTGGEGGKPTTGLYLGPTGLTATLASATDVRGAAALDGEDGSDGIDGWTPLLANVVDAERRVQRIVDWVGGEGTKPTTGLYVGPLGLTANIAEATNVRGAAGANGSGTGDMIAANNLSDLTDKSAARGTLSVYSKAEADATAGGKADLVGGKVPTAQLPALAITDVFEVATQAAMLALGAERGDVAIRTDENKSYVLAAEPSTSLANWKLLRTPTDVVLSVAGETGAITRAALMAALAYAIADIPGLQDAVDAKLAKAGGEMTGALRLKGFSEKPGVYTSGAMAMTGANGGSVFDAAISASVTISLSNLPASPVTGERVTAVLGATISGTPVITWPSGLVWAGATGPTLAAGYWEFVITARWTGSTWTYTGAWAKFF